MNFKSPFPFEPNAQSQSQLPLPQQQTAPLPALSLSLLLPEPGSTSSSLLPGGPKGPPAAQLRKLFTVKYLILLAVTLVLGAAIFFVWSPLTFTFSPASPALSPGITQQNFTNTSSPSSSKSANINLSNSSSGAIQVYIVGAVVHPGVYSLPVGARVYQLLQAAGGPAAKANLVALNLAATLTDGEEVYVTVIGEIPPTYVGGVPGPGNGTGNGNGNGNTNSGQLVNINTATVDQMRQLLHVSSTTAQNIVNYRTQNGPFTSVDQLLQVVSKSIYDRIKSMVTV